MASTQPSDRDPIRVLVLTDLDLGIHTRQRLTDATSEGLWLVGTASSREVAADLIANARPEVIVVDIDGEYGPETIADFAERSCARLLALTGSLDTELEDGAILAGACGVVQKREASVFLVDAIRCVHEGDMWISHAAADRILDELAHAREAAEREERMRTRLACLTLKERIIVIEITRGHSSTPGEIAARLRISEHALQDYLVSIHRKLELECAGAGASASRPKPFNRQAHALQAESDGAPSMHRDRVRKNRRGGFITGSVTRAEGVPPGNRGEDAIVVSSCAAHPRTVPPLRFRHLRRKH